MVEPLKRHHFITRTNMELFLSCIVTFFKQDVKKIYHTLATISIRKESYICLYVQTQSLERDIKI